MFHYTFPTTNACLSFSNVYTPMSANMTATPNPNEPTPATVTAATTAIVTPSIEPETVDAVDLVATAEDPATNFFTQVGGQIDDDMLPLDEPQTVFKVKHALRYSWTLWYLESDRTKSWTDIQNEVTSFNTIEDFWCLYSFIKRPSELKIGCDYYMFKTGIKPMWEDPTNINGGRWVITIPNSSNVDLNKLWLDVLLNLFSGALDKSGLICGATVNIRWNCKRITIWISSDNDKRATLEIGNKIRDYFKLQSKDMTFLLHKVTMYKQNQPKSAK